ncbi:hypothetical protein [Synechococcus elongatus]|uniref:hypothetical protein n=1 Tax=Synechococcus elongatus TaxID=32046 RepID=UPI00004600EB|nr:hypothetical protein [Synechococcus elongatus]AJD58841.1 hypothetical protein M744_01080 [Synechococcus elongatus UTEX 2973]MBD2588249.1 hypothetical protein [Synechococcus elongatus FACHB-242]MBD2689317.1 hypothetical protein [Synechococcus elongatus FACHB-1061]MBD2707043.1 hypothetical protein [Synechococcus elongatus PCC 7942 = FACHB-805]UOW70167.1 hypothetical protein PCC7943_0393 [Synechococcus elongatus PCC 7943]
MKSRFFVNRSLLLVMGGIYFVALSQLQWPVVAREFLALLPFQLVILWGLRRHWRSPQNERPSLDQNKS